MSAAVETILREAMQLDPIERAELLQRLFFSFAPVEDAKIDGEWRTEVEDRISAFKAGKVKADSLENVFKRLAER